MLLVQPWGFQISLYYPESDKIFIPTLSHKQAEWRETDLIKNGWHFVKAGNRDDSFIQAQKFANQGYFVVSITMLIQKEQDILPL
ncbi:hypothetical protein [Rickettsia sp. Tenjiku01]|uniref:hypothetical protein n=1 Tax=Rickettsia sp. Tenjiku01 TaxID=1736693 RepID=UPI000A645474|nr:hypothetical protein [Rickettsia sp. Tenjiku01]